MKTQIRFGTFETNSSSTHSITIVSKEQYDKWIRGECYFDHNKDKFISIEDGDIIRSKYAVINNNEVDFSDYHEIPVTYDEWYSELADYNETYKATQKINDIEIVAFGYYGYD